MTEKQKHGQSLCPGGKEAPLSRNDCKVCKGGQPLIVHIGKVNQILLSWWVSKVHLPLSCATYTKSQHNSRQQRSPKIYYKTCKHYSVCLVVDL